MFTFKTTKSIIISLMLSLAALSVGIWIFMYSPLGMGGLQAIAPLAQLPDTIDSPSIEVYRQVIENMGENGRTFYLHNIRMIDTIFPFLYTLPLYILLSAASRRVFRRPFIQHGLPVLAFTPAVFDLIENQYLHQLVHDFPDLHQSIVDNTLLFTTAKAITRDAIFYMMLVYWTAIGILTVIKYLRRRIPARVVTPNNA
jgi:hypothetical protein